VSSAFARDGRSTLVRSARHPALGVLELGEWV